MISVRALAKMTAWGLSGRALAGLEMDCEWAGRFVGDPGTVTVKSSNTASKDTETGRPDVGIWRCEGWPFRCDIWR